MTWFWWVIIILYIAGMFWYAKKRFDDADDDFLDATLDSILVVFWPLTLLLDWYFDVKY